VFTQELNPRFIQTLQSTAVSRVTLVRRDKSITDSKLHSLLVRLSSITITNITKFSRVPLTMLKRQPTTTQNQA